MGDRTAKNALFDGFAEIGKAVANGRRAELLDVLAQGERHVDALAAEIDQSVAATSFHLRVLAGAGLVTTRRDGTKVYYRLASERVEILWSALRDVAAAHLAELEQLAAAYLGPTDGIERVSQDELRRRVDAGDVIVIDVRPSVEYDAGHIATARSVPMDTLADQLAALPANADVVAYCRGPFCVYADDAVRFLRQRGRRAARLEDGYPEWRSAGLPVELAAAP
jgi:rhodanese-related sulfurtransferase/DNA-binding transcriptional ArsR family regulator